jgi:hypothetical protein
VNTTEHGETLIEISQRLMQEALAYGRVEIVGETDDGRTLFREVQP